MQFVYTLQSSFELRFLYHVPFICIHLILSWHKLNHHQTMDKITKVEYDCVVSKCIMKSNLLTVIRKSVPAGHCLKALMNDIGWWLRDGHTFELFRLCWWAGVSLCPDLPTRYRARLVCGLLTPRCCQCTRGTHKTCNAPFISCGRVQSPGQNTSVPEKHWLTILRMFILMWMMEIKHREHT